ILSAGKKLWQRCVDALKLLVQEVLGYNIKRIPEVHEQRGDVLY
ncbi:hypothetical protein L917_11486, partial [Phytophthora nicotianae]